LLPDACAEGPLLFHHGKYEEDNAFKFGADDRLYELIFFDFAIGFRLPCGLELLKLQLRDAGGFSIVSTNDVFHVIAISWWCIYRGLVPALLKQLNQFNESNSTAQLHF
jgi:hypothetical protein